MNAAIEQEKELHARRLAHERELEAKHQSDLDDVLLAERRCTHLFYLTIPVSQYELLNELQSAEGCRRGDETENHETSGTRTIAN